MLLHPCCSDNQMIPLIFPLNMPPQKRPPQIDSTGLFSIVQEIKIEYRIQMLIIMYKVMNATEYPPLFQPRDLADVPQKLV